MKNRETNTPSLFRISSEPPSLYHATTLCAFLKTPAGFQTGGDESHSTFEEASMHARCRCLPVRVPMRDLIEDGATTDLETFAG
jgi:hypothetical protein